MVALGILVPSVRVRISTSQHNNNGGLAVAIICWIKSLLKIQGLCNGKILLAFGDVRDAYLLADFLGEGV